MEKIKFLSGLKSQFEDRDSLNLDMSTKFRTMETWDSLTKFSIISFLEDEYKISIKIDELNNLDTPNDLFNFVLFKNNKEINN